MGSSLNIYDLKFDTSFSTPNALYQLHLSNSPSFKHLTEIRCESVRWMKPAQDQVQFWTARDRIWEWGIWTEKFLSERVREWWSVSESVSAGSSRSGRCQVSFPGTQTAGNSSSPGSWPLPIPATQQSSRWRDRKCWHKTPVELIKLCHPLLTPYVTTTILGEVLISW